MKLQKRLQLPLLLLCALAVTGCAATAAKQPDTGTAAVKIRDFADREISFAKVPERIVALGNGEMDIVYALGGNLVGRPTSKGASPVAAAEAVMQIGSTHEVDLEKITLVKPDVVLGNNPLNLKDIATIEGLGAKLVLTGANSVEELKRQITLLGQMIQREDQATNLVAGINAKIAEAAAKQPAVKPRVLLVYGAPGTNMAALPNSLIGDLLNLAGGDNIAAAFPSIQSFPQYAQLNTERIMEANPQFIFIISHGDSEAVKTSFIKEMHRNAAWNSLEAVKKEHIEILPSDLFGSSPGTRVTEALEMLQKLLLNDQ